LLNASVGVQRVLGRLRRPPSYRPPSATNLRTRSVAAAQHVQRGLHDLVAASRLVPMRDRWTVADQAPSAHRRSLIGRLGPDRAVAMAVVAILLGASVASVSAGQRTPSTGGPNGNGPAPRLAIGGGTGGQRDDSTTSGAVELGAPDPTLATVPGLQPITAGDARVPVSAPVDVEGPFIDDGTLVKPIAVDTTVPDGSALVRTYTVKAGDALGGIATEFGVSMMSVWWANNLKSKTDIHVGEVLRIPPVTGLIVKVAATDTLDGLAARYDVNSTDILATNGLRDSNLVVGQVLVIPGATGQAIPVAKPDGLPSVRTTSPTGSGGSVRPPSTYIGGVFLWPVVGGGNYISQYFHYGHGAIDIAADYGSTVRAAAAGTVTYAGWKSNGGGYQVWIAHGSGLYTTYNHMSAVTVHVGQHVGRGDQVGRIGQSGNATGPHLHFEVWIGPVWNGGTRVNPLRYL
jgi:murein DD-endopeptidase MepM/ murein hydrolase activator NlpD